MDYLAGDNIDWSTLTLASYRRKPGRDYASLLWELRKEGGRWWHTEGGISQYVPSWVEPMLQVFEGSCCEKRKHFCEGEIGGMGTEKYKATPGYATLNKDFTLCV